ncbi:dihydrolipoyl dehydrogenase [Theileria orientalis strain Shintoku]|uniref:Dihydrolipoyl dehydrogenase n=1 Tax=Theileria orientalis strain Shintoku TaxID=869250 RepID=J4D9F8_THEOR|nr:dihydrolipoyl dehydrogenase [Theileria orientalis strain Shintoku]BAM41355.1 dihydrolipoyl dehydrogenase [Theileria orientalis strain Shintoku]|eukprot:XP_009691656.1 dihydrolipoyl dehydrogenase [Theileria orientalis strain Shintoku]
MFRNNLNKFVYNNYRCFSTSSNYDLVVLGGGPGGYTMAIKAAQHNLKVAVVEKRTTLGGTCLNCGCIPSKSLLNTSHLFEKLKHGVNGVTTSGLQVDVSKMMAEKENVIKSLNTGIFGLFKKNKVDFFNGTGKFKGGNHVEVGQQVLTGKNLVIATGSEVTPFPHESLKVDGKFVISSTEALCLSQVPKKLLVIGAGAIGLELASVWSRLGSSVEIFEFNPVVCSIMDVDVSNTIKKVLEKQGVVIHTNAQVLNAKVSNNTVLLNAKVGGEDKTFVGDKVLVAMGRRAYTEGLGLDKLGVALDRGKVPTDGSMRVLRNKDDPKSVAENVYAIGDVTYGPMLAHKAEEDGLVALGDILQKDLVDADHDLIPSVIYTDPEISGLGVTEQYLTSNKMPYKKSLFPFAANSRAKIYGETDGFVKLLADEANRLLGAWLVGPHASEMVHQLALAIKYGATSEDVARVCFAHPSLSEAVKESALGIHFKPLHF